MKTEKMTFRFVWPILIGLGIVGACLLFNGCGDMYEAVAPALGLAGTGMNAKTPEADQLAAQLSEFASEAGSRQHEMEVAEAGRSQITINNNATQSSSSDQSIGSLLIVNNQQMTDGGTYSGQEIKLNDGWYHPHGSGIYTWSNGDRYDGEWKDGKCSGRGVYTWSNGNRYDGEWKDNIREGRGVLTFPDGSKYKGQFENDKYNGHGVYTHPKGIKYDGEFKDDRYDGRGVLTLPDGSRYDGEFEKGNCDGRGVLTSPDGYKYDGEVVDGLPHGHGVETWPSGEIYEGQFRKGKKEGQHRCMSPNGTTAVVEYREGQVWRINGTGVWPDGTKYIGEWNYDGSRSGGTIIWPDGRVYQGYWKVLEGKPDLPDGQGALTWLDGRKYIGDFREGKMHGLGKMTYPDGKVEEGAWRDDKFTGGGTPSSSGISKTGFVSVVADNQTFEVFVDGAFVGNISAKLKLSEGTHMIEVKKAGFKDYKKEIKVTEGCELILRAVLEKN